MKYKLQKYSGIASRYECPHCGRQHCFTLYIDENDVPVHESVGRCDHESSCGYNYTPWQYYQDHPPFERVIPEIKVVKPAFKPKPSYIPYSFIDKSVRLDRESDFIRFLLTILDPLIVEGLVVDYKLGVTKSGDVIFFQIDRFGRCRTGKVMKYNPEWRTKLSAMAGLDVTVSDYLERVATPEDRENHVDIADLLIRDNKEPARDSQSQTFLAIREFISPEYHGELEQLIDDLDLDTLMLDF